MLETCVWHSAWVFTAAVVSTRNVILLKWHYVITSPALTPVSCILQDPSLNTARVTNLSWGFVGFLSYSQICPCVVVYLDVGDELFTTPPPSLSFVIILVPFEMPNFFRVCRVNADRYNRKRTFFCLYSGRYSETVKSRTHDCTHWSVLSVIPSYLMAVPRYRHIFF